MKRKKILIIIILLIPIIIYGTKNYLTHKNCYSTVSNFTPSFSKTPESARLKSSIGQHFEKTYSSDSPKKLLNSLNTLFKCQLEVASDLEKSTTDKELKKLLNNYIKELKSTLTIPKDISNITYNHRTELKLKVFKTFDISLYKALIEIDEIYDVLGNDDLTSYIKYFPYIYDQSPNTYDTFTPDLESYYDFDYNNYINTYYNLEP